MRYERQPHWLLTEDQADEILARAKTRGMDPKTLLEQALAKVGVPQITRQLRATVIDQMDWVGIGLDWKQSWYWERFREEGRNPFARCGTDQVDLSMEDFIENYVLTI